MEVAQDARCRALLTLTSGETLACDLLAVLPQEEQVIFRAEGAFEPHTLPFSRIRVIREPFGGELAAPWHGIALYPTGSSSVPFSITYLDGKVWSGTIQAYGWAGTGCALAPSGEGTRVFLPSAQVRECVIGGLEEAPWSAPEHDTAQRLGERLLQIGLITPEQLQDALARQAADAAARRPLGDILVQQGLIDPLLLRNILAQKLGIPWIDIRRYVFAVPPGELMAHEVMRRHNVVPLTRTSAGIVVAMENPFDTAMLEQLRFITQQRIIPVLGSRDDIAALLADGRPAADEALPPGAGEDAELDEAADEKAPVEPDHEVVALVNQIILRASELGASDIHVEPRSARHVVRVRVRIDGAMHEMMTIPAKLRGALIARIKIMAALDISERRKGQDGKIEFRRGATQIGLRVATVPLDHGVEAAVLRILASEKPRPIDSLGMSPQVLASLKKTVTQPHGLVVVCGPTGSGKTTTLHSLLALLNTPDAKIWTAEDPVEIVQKGLSQVKVNPRAGWTFAAALRSLLRADPDVIMVGEMRDGETASIALEASLTGHFVLSTLHTNSAPDAAARLIDMGLDPFCTADALMGVLAQRLVRRLCSCAQRHPATPAELEQHALAYASPGIDTLDAILASWRQSVSQPVIGKPVGCPACLGSGFKGRVAVYEWMPITPGLKSAIQAKNGADELRARAFAAGMLSLRQDGIVRVLAGATTLDQVLAVCG